MFNRFIQLMRGTVLPPENAGGPAGGLLIPACDLSGVQWVRLSGGPNGVAVSGGLPDVDAIVPATVPALNTRDFIYGFNNATWDRLRTTLDSADAVAPLLGKLGVISRNTGFNGATWDRLRTLPDNADAAAAGVIGLQGVINRNQLFNGVTYDRERGNADITVLASAVRAATNQSADITNFNGRGLQLTFDITVVPGVQTVTLTIQGKDVLSGKYYTILAGAAQIGVATVVMRVYPALTAVVNLTANDILPRTWRVNVTHSGAGNFTYSVGASVIL